MATKAIKYPGALGKRITERELVSAVKRLSALSGGSGVTNAEFGDWLKKEFGDWLEKRNFDLLVALLSHYKIKPDDKHLWFRLAYSLASAHVPGFQLGVAKGRPKKAAPFRTLSDDPEIRSKVKVKLGRTRVRTDEDNENFLRIVLEVREEEGFSGHGADKKAIEKLLKDEAQKRGLSQLKVLSQDLEHFQKRHSDAKKKIPKKA